MKQWFDFFLDLLFSKFCLNCGGGHEYVCSSCFSKIKRIEFETCPVCEGRSLFGFTHPGCRGRYRLDGMIIGADYADPIVKKIVHRFKYQGKTAVAEELAEKFILPKIAVGARRLPAIASRQALQAGAVPLQIITYIPLHPDKERKRGFNQSEILAREIGKRFNIPVVSLLKRTVYNLPQMSLKKVEERRENVKGIFSFDGRVENPSRQNIALVDDVATSGATLAEAAKVLKHHGARQVWGIVLARKQKEN